MGHFCRLTYLYIFALVVGNFVAPAQAKLPEGYTQDVEKERQTKFMEIYLFLQPAPPKSDLSKAIWNSELSKEFKTKYREKFGQADLDALAYQTGRFIQQGHSGNNYELQEKESKERRAFGEYMTKRLTEWHVDNYFKTDPTMRPVYEAKEKLSNVEVKVNNQMKLNAQYSLAGNTLDVIVDNPWVDSRVALEMDPSTFGPSQVQENRLWIEKQLDSKNRVNTSTAFTDGIIFIEHVKHWKANLKTSLGFQNYFRNSGKTERQTKYLVGFSHQF